MSKKKTALLVGGIVVSTAIFSLVVQYLQLSEKLFVTAITFWMILMVGIYAFVTLRAGRKTVEKIEKVNLLLTEEHDLDAYIAGLKDLLITEKDSFQAQQILRINLTVAYWGKHDFKSALQMLQEIPDPRRLNRPNAAFYWANLALANFYNGNDEEGLRIVDLQRAAFTEMRKVKQPSPSLAFLEIFEAFYQGSIEDAHALFETARATWETADNAVEFALVAEKIGAELLPLPEKATEETSDALIEA
ncbi:MAG: hypothetical protein IJE22_02285 [Oscillibacter sp.]|nr:hypothetical protein [Oscillibacter sp.]